MLDAYPAPAAHARPPAAVPASVIADITPPRDTAASKSGALLVAARTLLPVLGAGRALDAPALRQAMTAAFGVSDAEGGWVWKDAYEAAEAALVLFLQRYGRAMRREAGAGPDGPAAMLHMLETLAALEPSQSRRSEEQLRLQQFSTPLPLAYAALQAAAIRPGDVVLEPSAGTGMLAVMAACALGNEAAGSLHLNEIAATRAGLLAGLFAGCAVTRHNAEAIADFLPVLRPTVVLMNPPFSASPGVDRIRHDADLRHIRSAFSMLPPGGRLVAISSAHCVPGDEAWTDAFASLDPPARTVFTAPIDGRAYARRGTTFDTRLTVLDRGGEQQGQVYAGARVPNAAHLLEVVTATVPARLPIEPVPGADLFGHAPASRPAPARRRRTTAAAPQPAAHDWGPVGELAYEAVPAASDTGENSHQAPTHASGPYEPWQPRAIHVPGAVAHPTPLVQSGAMAAVPHPALTYRPMLPTRIVTEGQLSDAQLESVVLAGQSLDRHLAALYRIGSGWETVQRLDREDDDDDDGNDAAGEDEVLSEPVRFRRGWMLGDGTGCGKGRQVGAIILDRWLRGTKRALWLSQSDKLLEDTRRDWSAIGGRADDVVPLAKVRQGADIPHAEGVLFATYATLRSPARQGKRSRLDQIVAWLAGGEDEESRHAFSGVIVFDEAHAMANAAGSRGERGEVRPSQQGRAGLRLQNALPDARVLYVSATGATTVPGLAYARRLGLWASGETPFETRTDFVAAMEAGGVAAMEVVARDLKALGLYQARALSYDGVEVDILEHPLTDEQRRIYDAYAGAFKIIHSNIQDALKATGIVDGDSTLNRNAKSAALSAFEGAKQRFFGHLLTSMKCPSLIRAIEVDLEAGRSAVVQLVSTGEALMERRIAEIPASEWDDLSIDLTPREYVLDFLAHAFPVHLQEPFTDDDGNVMSRPVFDADRNPVLCQEAVAKRDALIQRLGSLPPVQSALDQIVHRFGHDNVAEVTGRSRRVLRITDAKGERLALRSRPASANLAETAAFMDRAKSASSCSAWPAAPGGATTPISRLPQHRAPHPLPARARLAGRPGDPGAGQDPPHAPGLGPALPPRRDGCEGRAQVHRHHRPAPGQPRRHHAGSARLPDRHGQRTTPRSSGPATIWRAPTPDPRSGSSTSRFGGVTSTAGPSPTSRRPPASSSPGRAASRRSCRPCRSSSTGCWRSPSTSRTCSSPRSRPGSKPTSRFAIEAGTFERGVETIAADSLVVASRETVFSHEGSGAETEIVEILRRDRLEPLTADAALKLHAATSKRQPPAHGQRPVEARGPHHAGAVAHVRRRRRAGARAPGPPRRPRDHAPGRPRRIPVAPHGSRTAGAPSGTPRSRLCRATGNPASGWSPGCCSPSGTGSPTRACGSAASSPMTAST